MTPERVEGIVYMVQDLLYESPPNMAGLISIAQEVGLEKEMA
jgi:hypothetical protein